MTRKVRKSKLRKGQKKTKRRTNRTRITRRIKGGMFKKMGNFGKSMAEKYAPKDALDQAKGYLPEKQSATSGSSQGPEKLSRVQSLGKLIQFSLGSLIISPFYIMAVLANLPLNTLNNLSGKSFDKNTSDALGVQLYKYMFEGYQKNDIEKKVTDHADDYIIDDGLRVKGQLVTKCDSEKCDAPMKGGYVNTYKSIKEMMGSLSTNESIIHNLKSLEDMIDSMKMNFNERKEEIKKVFKNLKDPRLLFKTIVVCNNLIKDCKEGENEKAHLIEDNIVVKNPYKSVDGTFSSHFLMNVCYLNPECMKSCNKCDLLTSMACSAGTKTGPECDKCSCTLFNNMVSIYHSYARILLKTFAGNSNNINYISHLLFTIVRFHANKEDEDLDKKVYEMNIDLDNIDEIGYKGDFSLIIDKHSPEIELFKKIICKYGIYEIVKKNFKHVVQEAKNNNELEKLKASLLFICDAPDDQRENIKKGVKEMKKAMKNVLDGKIPTMFKKKSI